MSKANMFWEFLIGFIVLEIMSDVGQKGAASGDSIAEGNCLVDTEMDLGAIVAQGAQDQGIDTFNLVDDAIFILADIGNVGEIPKAVPRHLHIGLLITHVLNIEPFKADFAEVLFQNLEVELRLQSTIGLFGHEQIVKTMTKLLVSLNRRQSSQSLIVFEVENAQLVDSPDVIVMRVSEKNPIEIEDIVMKCLIAKVGTHIEKIFFLSYS